MRKILGLVTILIFIGFAATFFYLEKVIANKKVTHQLYLDQNLCLNLSAQCVHKSDLQQLTLFCHSGSTYHFSLVSEELRDFKEITKFEDISMLEKENTVVYSGPSNNILIKITEPDSSELNALKTPVPCLRELKRIVLKSGQN